MIDQRKRKSIRKGLVLSVFLVFCVVIIQANTDRNSVRSESSITADTYEWELSAAELAKLYGKYGITYQDHTVFYYGERVQQFVDGGAYYQGGGFWCEAYYQDSAETEGLYLHVIRSDQGQIEGIEIKSKDMLTQLYGQNTILDYQPNQDFVEQKEEEKYQAFSKYGLEYDNTTKRVFYYGEEVKAFIDGGSKYKKGGYWFHISFFNSDHDSSLYLHSIRDKNGKITGITEMSPSKIQEYFGEKE